MSQFGSMGPDAFQQMLDQGEAGLVGVAKLLGTYRRQLREEGFSEDQVKDMCLALQMAYLRPRGQQPGEAS